MNTGSNRRDYLPFLDIFRAGAAFLVVLEHARNYLWKDYGELASCTLLTKLAYFASQFGHEAVMLFFVLSGCVVGRCVVDPCECRRWNWRDYLFARLSRLWTVLIPAVFITLAFDNASLSISSSRSFVHHGGFAHIQADPLIHHISTGTLLGNILFVQKILVPTLGSNGPLWSLAYEFWYYLIFPLLWVPFAGRSSWWTKLVSISIAVGLLMFVGKSIAMHFPIWLFGVVAYVVSKRVNVLSRRMVLAAVTVTSFATFISLCVSRMGLFNRLPVPNMTGELCIAACFAALICFAVQMEPPRALIAVGKWLASFSYSLYVVHLPLLTFLIVPFVESNADRFAPSIKAWVVLGVALFASYGFAIMFYLLIERNTSTVRRWLQNASRIRRSKGDLLVTVAD